jgi:predicted GNAT family acetyltransferase
MQRDDIRHETHGDRGSFFIHQGGKHVAELTYSLAGKDLFIDHTYVAPEMRGRDIADGLVAAAVDHARKEGRMIIPACPYVKSVFDKTPDYADVRRPPAKDDEDED